MSTGRAAAPAGEVTEADGHTWLAASPWALRWRRAGLVGVLAVGVALAMPVVEGQGLAAGFALIAALLALAAWPSHRLWRAAHTRVGVGPAGVLVQRGARTRMLGWDSVDGLEARASASGRGRRPPVAVSVAGDGQTDRLVWRCRADDVERWQRAVAAHQAAAAEG